MKSKFYKTSYFSLPFIIGILFSNYLFAQCDASFSPPPQLCFNDVEGLDLNTLVTGDLGGTWTTTAPENTLNGSVFEPLSGNLKGGVYTISYTICEGQVATDEITILEPIAVFEADQNTICPNNSINFTNQSLFAGNSFEWEFFEPTKNILLTSNEKSPSITFLETGIYDVTLRIKCDIITTQQISVIDPINAQIEANSSQICAGQILILTANSDSPTDQYIWHDEQGNELANGKIVDFSPLQNTIYTLKATNSEGCESTAEIAIEVLPNKLEVFPKQATVCAGATLELSAVGFANSFSWSPMGGEEASNSSSIKISPIENITYVLTADIQGCIAKDTIEVTIADELGISIVPSQKVICEAGETVILEAYGAKNYNWLSHPSIENSVGNRAEVIPLENTIYEVVGNDDGACSGKASIELQVADLEVFINNNAASCQGETIVLNSTVNSSFSNNFNYQWSPTTGLDNPKSPNPTATISQNITYNLIVTDEFSCQSIASTSIDIIPEPTLTASQDPVCEGETVSLKVNGPNVTVIDWLPNDKVNPLSTSAASVQPTETTEYCAVGSYSNGCIFSKCLTLQIAQPINITFEVSSEEVCKNGIATITAVGTDQFIWLPADGLLNNSGATVEVQPQQTTTYTVIGEDNSGCFSQQATVTIAVNSNESPQFSQSPEDITICNGDETTLEVLADVPDNQIQWSPADGLSSTTGSNIIATPNTTTTYTITASNSAGCTTSTSVKVRVEDVAQNVSVFPENPIYCTNGDSLTLSLNGTADSYRWLTTNDLNIISQNQVKVAPSQATTYIVNADFGICSQQIEIFVDVATPLTTSISENTSLCKGTSLLLNASGGDTFEWFPKNLVSNASIANPIINPSQSGIYRVKISDSQTGCYAFDSVEITVLDVPQINLNGASRVLCSGENLDISAIVSNADNIQWEGGKGSFSDGTIAAPIYTPAVDELGEILLTISAENSCGQTFADLKLDINNAASEFELNNTSSSFCEGETIDLEAVMSDGGILQWSGGQGTFSAPNDAQTIYLPAQNEFGTINLVADFDNGCQQYQEQLSLEILPESKLSIEQNIFQITSGEKVDLIATGGTQYEWSPSVGLSCTDCPQPTATPAVTTIYTVRDPAACGEALSITIEVEARQAILLPTSFSPNNDGVNDELKLFVSEVDNFHLQIFNRWGVLVFESIDPNLSWNGQSNTNSQSLDNQELSIGSYFYILNYQFIGSEKVKRKTGSIALIR